ncbi:protein PRRC2C-like [Epinephelus moara]|uniref:protein PRRC2C-like n=1 Tax=Epinephelus moara TaxID=300413 RepID=UPI00214E8C4F|nr:protein PRRC2C-like [Epinephelus moara]
MDSAVPSHLPTPVCDVSTPVPHGKQAPVVKRRQTAVASKRRPDRQQVAAKPRVAALSTEASATSPTRGAVVEEVEAASSVVEVSSQASPTSPVLPAGPARPILCAGAAPPARAAREEAEATLTLGAVEVTSEPSPTSPVPVAVGEEKSLQMQRTPLSTKGQTVANPLPCRCSEKLPPSIVAGTDVRVAQLTHDVNSLTACSVVAAIKHAIAPVCTWRASDVDEVGVEGSKLAVYVAQEAKKIDAKQKQLCKLIEQHSVFGRNWKVAFGKTVYRRS